MPSGKLYIEGSAVTGRGRALRARNPATGLAIDPGWAGASADDIEQACNSAALAAPVFAATSPATRATFLDSIATHMEQDANAIVERAMLETGYARPRLEGELGRTTTQLRLFGSLLRDGRALDVRFDRTASDLRLMRVGLGPVAVFGASNFPLAFSTAGGDTASALAAGCPVVVKGHPAHPGTGELVAAAVVKAVASCGLPTGVFSWLTGSGHDVGTTLVRHPAIAAVGFTGSRGGGIALMKTAAMRPVPIPVYAEMSSVNPVFLLPAALAARGESIAQAFVDSMCLGAGQFCTNPGVVLGIQGADFDAFVAKARAGVSEVGKAPLLSDGIRSSYLDAIKRLHERSDVETLVYTAPDNEQGVPAALFRVTASALMDDPSLADEIFGPASLLVSCTSTGEMARVVPTLEGQLTATLHVDQADIPFARELIGPLTARVGRVLCNAFPTGVAVSDAMVHGGPFPATSDGRSTSVGLAAIERFQRPVCFQDVPDELLPDELRDSNPLGVPVREGLNS